MKFGILIAIKVKECWQEVYLKSIKYRAWISDHYDLGQKKGEDDSVKVFYDTLRSSGYLPKMSVAIGIFFLGVSKSYRPLNE